MSEMFLSQAQQLTVEDLNLLIEAVRDWESALSRDHLMADLVMGGMEMRHNDEDPRTAAARIAARMKERESEREAQRIDRHEKSVLIQAKLINLRKWASGLKGANGQ